MASGFNLNDASVLKAFKTKYAGISDACYNNANVTWGKAKKSYNLTGEKTQKLLDLGFSGGIGFSRLPQANRAPMERVEITPQKLYASYDLDRATWMRSKGDAGAFVDGNKESVRKTVETVGWAQSLVMWGTGTGELGTVDSGGVTDNGSGSYSLVISSATYRRANFFKGQIVNIEAANYDPFEVTAVVHTTRTVTVSRLSGSQVPVATDVVYLQNSYNAVPQGIPGILDKTSGTAYGVTIQDGWKSTRVDGSSGTINVDLLNQGMLEVEEGVGVAPNLIVCSYTQYRKLIGQLEDQKRYMSTTEVKSRKGDFSWSGIQYLSTSGPVPIVVERFCAPDRVYLLNTDHIEIMHVPGSPGWQNEDGTVFLRKQGEDGYEARYSSYFEIYVEPTWHGVIHTLSTAA